jgi:hypothetical protein
MTGSAPLTPLTLLGASAPLCEGDACLVPAPATASAAESSPAAPTGR